MANIRVEDQMFLVKNSLYSYFLILIVIFSNNMTWAKGSNMNEPLVNIPSVDELFERMAIRMECGPSRVYAYTDKVGGFWEGRIFRKNENGGYTTGGTSVLVDFLIFNNGTGLLRSVAEEVVLLPHQIQYTWFDGSLEESLTVLNGIPGMIIGFGSREAAPWLIMPICKYGTDRLEYILSEDKRSLILKDQESREYVIMSSADRDVWEPKPFESQPPYPDPVGDNYFCPYQLRIPDKKNAEFIVLFGQNPDSLVSRLNTISLSPSAFVDEKKNDIGSMLLDSYFETNDPDYDMALHWAKVAGDALVVKQFGTGIWAGLPWFNQSWGRDTFIALPGISLATGQFEEAAEIIRSFATYQITDPDNELFGRVPNRVNSPSDIIYNTTDGTPWLIREIAEYTLYTGDTTFAAEMYPVIEQAIQGALKYFVDDLGFMTHDDADTWMDARIRGKDPWSPRGDRAVEIQALWFTQLRAGAYLARILRRGDDANYWEDLADNVRDSFMKFFWDSDRNSLYDHLNEDGSPDLQIRPNQIFALTIPLFGDLVDPERADGIVREVVSELTYPYGVASLSQNDPYFHPIHHDDIYHFDAAYHNGMCWHWNAGPVIGGMIRTGHKNLAYELTRELARQIVHEGMPGSLSELVEPFLKPDGSLTLTGTYSQAWSVSEFVRNFYQDYLGVRPNMLERIIELWPQLPDSLDHVVSVVNIGMDEQIGYSCDSRSDSFAVSVQGLSLSEPVEIRLFLSDSKRCFHELKFTLKDGQTLIFRLTDTRRMSGELDGATVHMTKTDTIRPSLKEDLEFQKFSLSPEHKTIEVPHYLENIILGKAE